jgi:hypothetical protein
MAAASPEDVANAVAEVTKKIGDLQGLDEWDVRRFVLARQANADQATTMLQARCDRFRFLHMPKSRSRANTWQDHLKWRKRVKPDELPLITEVPEVLEKFKPGGQCGIDKEGSPVFYERTGMSYVRRSVLLSRTCRARARACVESRRV